MIEIERQSIVAGLALCCARLRWAAFGLASSVSELVRTDLFGVEIGWSAVFKSMPAHAPLLGVEDRTASGRFGNRRPVLIVDAGVC